MLRALARIMGAEPEPSLVAWDEFMSETGPLWNFPGVTCMGYATNHATRQMIEAAEPWLRERHPRDPEEFFKPMESMIGGRQWTAWVMDILRDGVQPTEHFRQQIPPNLTYQRAFRRFRFLEPEKPTFEADDPFIFKEYLGPLRPHFDHVVMSPVQDAALRGDVAIQANLVRLNTTNGLPLSLATMLVPVPHPQLRKALERLPLWDHAYPDVFWPRWVFNRGLVFADLDFVAILKQIQGDVPQEVDVEIYAQDTQSMTTEEDWLNPRPGFPRLAVVSGHRTSRHQWDRWLMYGKVWGLYFYTTPLFDQRSTVGRAWWAGGMGIVVTALFCWA